MPIDPNIALQVRQFEVPNSLAKYAQMQQIQGAQNQNRLSELMYADREREIADADRKLQRENLLQKATRDALNKLGIGFDTAPAVSGFAYDPQDQVYVQNPDFNGYGIHPEDPNYDQKVDNVLDYMKAIARHPMPETDWVFDVTDIVREGNSYSFFDNDMFIATFQEADLNGHKVIETMVSKPAIRNNMLLTVQLGDFVGDDEQDPRAYVMSFVGLKSK